MTVKITRFKAYDCDKHTEVLTDNYILLKRIKGFRPLKCQSGVVRRVRLYLRGNTPRTLLQGYISSPTPTTRLANKV